MRQTSDAMTQLNEAIARYHRILESESYQDLSWVDALEQKLQASHLTTRVVAVSLLSYARILSRSVSTTISLRRPKRCTARSIV